MSGKLYIASKFIETNGIETPFNHAYIVYAPNVIDNNIPTQFQEGWSILRGGPENEVSPFGVIIIEAGRGIIQSADTYIVEDRQGNLVFETPEDRNLTLLEIGNQDAQEIYEAMVRYAVSLKISELALSEYTTPFGYDKFGPNSNSFISSVLSAVGIDFRQQTPFEEGNTSAIRQSPFWFLGHTDILDGSGSDTFTAFSYNNALYTFYDSKGADTIIVEAGARLAIVKDGDATSSNTVVLQDVDLASLTMGVSYTLNLNDEPQFSGDFAVQTGGADYFAGFDTPLLQIDNQYGANGMRNVSIII